MARRELAAREHIVEHQPGEGQEAFAPRRRDMAQFRQDQAKKSSGDMRQPAAATVNPSLSKNARDNPNHPLNQLAKRKAQLESRQEVATTLKSPGPGSSDDDASSPPVSEEESSAVIERPPSPPLLSSSLCTSYFVEPLSWMGSVLQTGAIGGRLTCPAQKCGAKLGSFDWAGQQCSCGAWVVPAFSLNASKVDEL